jgi:hypothetical protein
MTAPDESTAGKKAARNALEESRQATSRTDGLIAEMRATLTIVREHAEPDFYVERFRAIIRGAR